MASIKEINTRLQTMSISVQKEEMKKALMVLMEDNLTKAKRALMVTTGRNVQELESKAQIGAVNRTTIAKLKETLIKKFVIFRAIEKCLRNRVLHLKPETIGFISFTPAEYLEEMLGQFMNARTK